MDMEVNIPAPTQKKLLYPKDQKTFLDWRKLKLIIKLDEFIIGKFMI